MTYHITITGINEDATASERADVTIGKSYEVIDMHGQQAVDPYFIDDAGEQNFGCDEDDTVYQFTVQSGAVA